MMAIWQFSFHILPKDKALNCSSVDAKNDSFEEIISWKGYSLKDSSIEQLSKLLKANKSWSDSNILFGTYESNCVQLFYDDTILEEVSVRLDLRHITLSYLNTIINFIEVNDAVIITSDGLIINPNTEAIIKVIKNSNEYLFLSDPEHFLESIDKDGD